MVDVTAREFNQNASAVKRAADTQIVYITDRGRPSHVLMSMDMFARMTAQASLLDALVMPDGDDIDFEPPRLSFEPRVPDLG